MRGADRGFTLIEVLVALAVVTMLLLAASRIYWLQRQVSGGLATQRRADRALENTYEWLRANPAAAVDATFPQGGDEALVVTSSVSPVGPRLRRLDLVASYRVRGQPFRRTLSALLYSP